MRHSLPAEGKALRCGGSAIGPQFVTTTQQFLTVGSVEADPGSHPMTCAKEKTGVVTRSFSFAFVGLHNANSAGECMAGKGDANELRRWALATSRRGDDN